jgi:glycine dehydrogenase subunit 1
MAYKYFPHTEEDIKEMLAKIGVGSLEDLYAEVPDSIKLKRDYQLPEALSEVEIRQLFDKLGKKNHPLTCFAGAGVYDHYTPSAISSLVERSEFLTSYTPYQAEISQGTLHYIFEFQSMMAELTGMEISNASMYDGTTATAEAVLMANAVAKKANKVLLSETIDPKILAVVRTYAHYHGVELEMIKATEGITDKADLQQKMEQDGIAGVVVQQPNRYGIIENYAGYADICHEKKALFIMNSVPADLALLKTPGELGADIAVGDGQSLGIPMSFGGSYVGYMCCTEKLMRKMPGRIVGKTVDQKGQRAFVLTLQAREQHIRRQKATSNICSNESLMALWVTIYMSLMGKEGVKEAAQISYDGAHYLYNELLKNHHFEAAFNQPFFNEFCIKYHGDGNTGVDQLLTKLEENGILGGVKIAEDTIMMAVTEKRTKEEVDHLIALCHE